ncbi:antitoxin VapB family protein [Acidianus sp. HS-5]|uniref:antitoxin VapB family protein n=1 Tax=Acidianus sp. HS-5 TaxID=2886040 RepID=UPI001F252782|nr:antitoxin VapB family protein [Acidianus sp. HS-5]
MSETIRVSKEVKRELLRIMEELQIEKGENVDFNDVIEFLLSLYKRKNPENLRKLVGLMPNISAEDLVEEKRN